MQVWSTWYPPCKLTATRFHFHRHNLFSVLVSILSYSLLAHGLIWVGRPRGLLSWGMAWISSGWNKQKLLWKHLKHCVVGHRSAGDTADKGSSWLGELWVSARMEETSQGFWRALGIHMDDSLLTVQQGGSHEAWPLPSVRQVLLQRRHLERSLDWGLGSLEENQLQLSHVMATCPLLWQVLEFA